MTDTVSHHYIQFFEVNYQGRMHRRVNTQHNESERNKEEIDKRKSDKSLRRLRFE